MNLPYPHFFDSANAQELCALSADAYGESRDVERAYIRRQYGGTQVLHDCCERDLLIAFRGTADLHDWLTDLNCQLAHVADFRVHRGFYEAVSGVEMDLAGYLRYGQRTRLWVTGHSLGGALAQLWALSAAERGRRVAGVYTFGQPRVGDAAFAERYDSVLKSHTFRVVHADDIVPRIPWQLGRYRHAGHEVFFPDAQGPMSPYYVDLPWLRKLRHDLPALARGLQRGKLGFLDDHHVSRYQSLFSEARQTGRVPCTNLF